MSESMTKNGPTIQMKKTSSLLTLEDNECLDDVTYEQESSGGKLLYKVDDVPPPGIVISVALQVSTHLKATKS